MISNLCYNNNTSKIKKQASNINLYNPVPLRLIQSDIEDFLNDLPIGYRKVFNIYLWFQNTTNNIYVSQGYIARKTGLSRKHVNTIVNNLCHWGFLYKWTRYMNTCLYSVSRYFLKPEIRNKLSWILSALIQLPLAWLMGNYVQSEISPLNQGFQPEVTLINSNIFILTKTIQRQNYTHTKRDILLDGEDSFRQKQTKTIRKVENMNEEKKFTLPLSQIKQLAKEKLSLNQNGLVALHMFDDKAIKHALDNVRIKTGQKADYWRIFCSYSHKWHKEHNVLLKKDDYANLEAIYPIPAEAKYVTVMPVVKDKISNANTNKDKDNCHVFNKKINIVHPSTLPGLDPEVAERIKKRREEIVNKSYSPIIETREEAFEKIEKFNKSPKGLALAKMLGFTELPNPFKDNTTPMSALREILNTQNNNDNQIQQKIIELEEYLSYNNREDGVEFNFSGI